VVQLLSASSNRGVRVRTALVGAVVLLCAAIALPSAAAAAEHPATSSGIVRAGVDDFVFDSYDGEFLLGRDSDRRSTLRTVETFVAVFPANQNRGMRRAIPDNYQGEPVDVSNISVTDEFGAQRPFDVEHDDGFTLVTSAADSFVSGVQTYVFSYEQSNVTRYFSDTGNDEWYWDTNGVGWDQPFGEAAVTVHLANGLANALVGEPRCYWGDAGSTAPCDITSGASSEFTATQSDLAPVKMSLSRSDSRQALLSLAIAPISHPAPVSFSLWERLALSRPPFGRSACGERNLRMLRDAQQSSRSTPLHVTSPC